jgi:hypothetical protein
MLFSSGGRQQQIEDREKCRQIAVNFDCHADAAVEREVHRLLEHIQGYTGSHWMPPLGKCLCCTAPAAAMVDKFVENTQNTNKTQLLASNYGTLRSLVVYEKFNPNTNPLLSSLMRQTAYKCERA